MRTARKYLILPFVVSALVLGAVFLWGGTSALIIAAILAALEVTLSFDNAIVNAKVLEQMSPAWQQRFLTWGILIAVVGVRLILPVIIVSAVTMISPITIGMMAFYDPTRYAELVAQVRPSIEAFGGVFLLMIALRYFFDEAKRVHWIHIIERRLCRWGRIEAIEAAIALVVLMFAASHSHASPYTILTSGVIGLIVFVFVDGITVLLDSAAGLEPRRNGTGVTTRSITHTAASSAVLFVYLEMVDVAFSLDGVMGAFALTILVPVMVAGLGIGAYFVRSLTVAFVEGGTLKELRYLEHGAHYAIGALALSMLASLWIEVPEWLVAGTSIVIIALAYLSSRLSIREATI
ncbi:MAG TPA: DUF475 domain-containing protein [Candidatus Paceibacterota bacterium]